LKDGEHLEDLGIDVGVILRFILNNSMGRHELDSSGAG